MGSMTLEEWRKEQNRVYTARWGVYLYPCFSEGEAVKVGEVEVIHTYFAPYSTWESCVENPEEILAAVREMAEKHFDPEPYPFELDMRIHTRGSTPVFEGWINGRIHCMKPMGYDPVVTPKPIRVVKYRCTDYEDYDHAYERGIYDDCEVRHDRHW